MHLTSIRPLMRRAAAASAVALLATGAVACGSDEGSEKAAQSARTEKSGLDGTLLWVQPLRDHPVHRLMQAGFKQECKRRGWKCEVIGNPSATNFDVPATIALADAAMAKEKVAGVGVYATDPALYPYVKKLAGGGLPVVSWHGKVAPEDVPGLKAVAGTDPAIYAKEVAETIGAKINGKGTVAITQGSINTTENLVSKVFTETMKQKYPDVKVLKPQVEGFEPSSARAKAVSLIQAHPDLAAAFSTTGGGPATWSGAAHQTGRDSLMIIAMDYVRQNLDLVRDGKVYGVVGQPLYEEGAKVADLLASLAQGEQVEFFNYIPAPIITKDKVNDYYSVLDKAGQ